MNKNILKKIRSLEIRDLEDQDHAQLCAYDISRCTVIPISPEANNRIILTLSSGFPQRHFDGHVAYTVAQGTIMLFFLSRVMLFSTPLPQLHFNGAFTDTRQNFFAPCLFYFTVHRFRENPLHLLSLHYNFSRVIAYR